MNEAWDEGANPWTVKSTRIVHQDQWLELEANAVVRPDGSEGDYNVVRMRRLGVGILPIEADGSVHMIGQWRFPLKRYSWELPEGGGEAGEDALTCARRELAEETGLHAAEWVKVLELDLSTSLTDERGVVFLATGLTRHRSHPEAREVIKHRRAHFLDVLDRVIHQQIREATTVASVLRAYQMAVMGQLDEPLARAMLRKPTGE